MRAVFVPVISSATAAVAVEPGTARPGAGPAYSMLSFG
jgi:hypothetical protein